MQGWAVFIIVILIIGLLAAAAWFAYTKLIRQRSNPGASVFPTPAPSNVLDWVKEKWHSVRNPKSQSGAGYEAPSRFSGARRGAALDPDEAWDSRVGNEADVYGPGGYYEEQELGLHAPTAYRGGGGGGFEQTGTAGGLGYGGAERMRSKSPAGAARSNPFGDENEASLRSVSPRPDLGVETENRKPTASTSSSPTTERRSMFRENM